VACIIIFPAIFFIINQKDNAKTMSYRSLIVGVEPADMPKLRKALESELSLKEAIYLFDSVPYVTMKDTPENWKFIRKYATVKTIYENRADTIAY
jgi:hypothetical protein